MTRYPFRPGVRVRTAEREYGYIQSISADGIARVNSERWEWHEDIPVVMLFPAQLYYSPATATEPAETNEEDYDDVPY